jgi:hypothetical protein
MKHAFRLLLILIAAAAYGQKTFEVQDFSPDFYGKVFLAKPSEIFTPGWVAIYEKKTNRQLIKISSEALAAEETEDGKIKANVKELPYGEQSVIIYEDFNFDGVKDFALMDGQNSCYGGPSFQIYLAAGRAKNKFVLSRAFTRLAQDYCGMFQIDREKKLISTMTKSGCCWHEFSEFIVAGNAPKAVKVVEEDAAQFPLINVTRKTWNGTKMVETKSRTIDFAEDSELKVLLSFKTRSGDRIVLFKRDDLLSYLFINRAGNVEFAYPVDSAEETPVFTLDKRTDASTLSFSNKEVVYRIYETQNEGVGVQIDARGKKTDVSGDPASLQGSLSRLADENLSNVILKK